MKSSAAVMKTALVGCEEYHGGSDFVGATNSAHRDGKSHVSEQLLLLAIGCKADQSWGLHRSGDEGVDPNIVAN
jgi:hypothetical protein